MIPRPFCTEHGALNKKIAKSDNLYGVFFDNISNVMQAEGIVYDYAELATQKILELIFQAPMPEDFQSG